MSWFESWYDKMMNPLEKGKVGEWRKELLSRARGKVLEVGAGTGANLPYYPAECDVIGIEPSEEMRQQAVKKVDSAVARPNSVEFLPGAAERLPFADDAFDTVLATLVLCSVDDPHKSVKEMRRVLKPGGTLLLLEHVAVKPIVLKGFQDILTPAWRRMMGNCHLNRDTAETVQGVFENVQVRSYAGGLFLELEAQK